MGHEKHEQLIKLRNQKQKTEKLKEATLDWLCEINKPKAKLENSDRRQATEETEDRRQKTVEAAAAAAQAEAAAEAAR